MTHSVRKMNPVQRYNEMGVCNKEILVADSNFRLIKATQKIDWWYFESQIVLPLSDTLLTWPSFSFRVYFKVTQNPFVYISWK